MKKINWALVAILFLFGIVLAMIISFLKKIFFPRIIAIPSKSMILEPVPKSSEEIETEAELTKNAEILLEQKLKEVEENTTQNGE